MKNCFVVVCSVAVLFSASGVMAAGSGVLSEITTCYQKAGENTEQINHCLNEEYEAVVAEYKDVTERVAVIAKSWDKPNRNRCLLYTSPSPRDLSTSRMPSSA